MRQHLAVVKFEAEDRVAASGRPYSSVAVAIDGQEQLTRLFAPPGHEPFRALRRGQQVAIAVDSQGRAHLLEQPEQQAPAAAAPMGFHTQPQPVVQQQQAPVYGAAPAPVAADPVIDLAEQWARAFSHLVSRGVDPVVAGPGASTIVIQLGRR